MASSTCFLLPLTFVHTDIKTLADFPNLDTRQTELPEEKGLRAKFVFCFWKIYQGGGALAQSSTPTFFQERNRRRGSDASRAEQETVF